MTLSAFSRVGLLVFTTGATLLSGMTAAGQTGQAVKVAAAMPLTAPKDTKVYPLSEVHRGLHGVAYTVFEGVTPEPMEVEILGVLKDAIGPGQDMILARLHGDKPEYTGVVAGMSGSPVYIDGRLAGALSYRIGVFSKEPIAGITPIEQMFEVRDGGATGVKVAATGGLRQRQTQIPYGEDRRQATATSAGGEIEPIATPLVFGGFSQEAVQRFGEGFRVLGLEPVAGLGGAEAGTKQPEPLVPGSVVSAILVRGDLSMSGTCTVTYVDPTRLLACGHPITQFGPVSMPMTKAEVVATLASPYNAFKIINTTETVGSFTEDRASAILGQFGVAARMIPVSVDVVSALPTASGMRKDYAKGAEQEGTVRGVSMQVEKDNAPSGMKFPVTGRPGMRFEVLDNRELTPQAMLVSVYQSLEGTNSSAAEMSYRMSGELTVAGLPPVRLAGIMSPTDSTSGAVNAALYVNSRFGQLYQNSIEQPVVTGLHLKMEAIPERRTAVLEGARLGQTEVHAGDLLDVEASVHPYQADAHVVHLQVRLPATLTPGQLRVVVSDGATLDRLLMPGGGAAQHPVGLADAVAQMNRLHENDRLYVTLLDHAAQAVLDSGALPAVPLSMANVFEPLKASQKIQLTGESAVEAGSALLDYTITGSQVLTIAVR